MPALEVTVRLLVLELVSLPVTLLLVVVGDLEPTLAVELRPDAEAESEDILWGRRSAVEERLLEVPGAGDVALDEVRDDLAVKVEVTDGFLGEGEDLTPTVGFTAGPDDLLPDDTDSASVDEAGVGLVEEAGDGLELLTDAADEDAVVERLSVLTGVLLPGVEFKIADEGEGRGEAFVRAGLGAGTVSVPVSSMSAGCSLVLRASLAALCSLSSFVAA